MTSPLATLDAQRVRYFDAPLRDDVRPFDDVDCYTGEDVKLIFTVKDANDIEVDLSGATISFKCAVSGDSYAAAVMEKTLSSGISVSGGVVTVLFNGDDLGTVYTRFMAQLIITKTSKTVVATRGIINLCKVIS